MKINEMQNPGCDKQK